MGRLLLFGWLAAAAPLCAQEVPLTFHPRADTLAAVVGDRVQVTLLEEWKIRNAQTREGDPAPLVLLQHRKTQAVYVREVTAIKKKRVTAYRLTFSEWTYTSGGKAKQVHTDLAGREVTLTVRDGRFVLPKGDELPHRVRRFLEGEARRLSAPDLVTFLPKRPLKEGDRWTVAAKDAAQHLVQDARLDPKRSSVNGNLERLYAQNGRSHAEVGVSSSLRLRTLPGTDTQITKGGVWSVKSTYDLPIGQPLTRASVESTTSFKGVGTNKRPDGAAYTQETSASMRRSVKIKLLPTKKPR